MPQGFGRYQKVWEVKGIKKVLEGFKKKILVAFKIYYTILQSFKKY
jgi:hypothetical protein